MKIKVLGTGCAKCIALEKKIRELVSQNSIDAEVEKVTDLQQIMAYGIMMTPGIVVNEKVVSFGKIPRDTEIMAWINGAK